MSDAGPQPPDARGPLADLRVIDLSTVLAGPNCARYLADFGAEVIKVERPDGGDSLRNMAWRDPRDGEGLWWKQVNRNKRTIALDLKNADDVAVLKGLLSEAHVLVENFRPGTLERLGLGPEVLHAHNPALVITRSAKSARPSWRRGVAGACQAALRARLRKVWWAAPRPCRRRGRRGRR